MFIGHSGDTAPTMGLDLGGGDRQVGCGRSDVERDDVGTFFGHARAVATS